MFKRRLRIANRKLLRVLRILPSRRCHFAVIFIIGVTSLSLFYCLLQWNVICLNVDIENQLNDLCEDYHSGKAHGNLCKPICEERNIHLLSCLSKHTGKVAVFTAWWNNTLIIIKSHKAKSDYFDLHWMSNGSKIFPTVDEFQEMLSQSLSINLGIQHEVDNIFPLLFPFVQNSSNLNQHQMISLWNLAQDNEYVLLMVHEHLKLFPKVLGTCGTFFAVEYAKPISELEMFTDELSDWIVRVEIAKLILELLGSLNSFFDPMHICDVKLEHFGLLGKRLVILDADTLFPKSVIDRNTADQSTCERHQDCDFFDCHSLCNKVIQRCDTPVVNNNLQVICKKIFIESGLLASKHLPKEKRILLEECANPYRANGRQAAPLHIQQEFLSFFGEFLSYVQ